MPIYAKKGISGEKAPIGLNNAICIAVVDLGIQITIWNEQEKKQHKVAFCWELEAKHKTGDWAGKPFIVTKEYTNSLGDKSNLSKDLTSWFSRKISPEQQKAGIDLEKMIGKKASLNMVESDNGEYVNVGNVLPPNPSNQLIVTATQADVPHWITDKLAKSVDDFGDDPAPEFNQERQPGEDLDEPLILADDMPW